MKQDEIKADIDAYMIGNITRLEIKAKHNLTESETTVIFNRYFNESLLPDKELVLQRKREVEVRRREIEQLARINFLKHLSNKAIHEEVLAELERVKVLKAEQEKQAIYPTWELLQLSKLFNLATRSKEVF